MKWQPEDALFGAFLLTLLSYAVIMGLAIYDNQKESYSSKHLIGETIVINNDTFRIISSSKSTLILDNGTMIEYKDVYKYLRDK